MLLLGHAGIVFEFEIRNSILLVLIAHDAAERRHRTDASRQRRSQFGPFATDVEVVALNRDLSVHAQPPVIGGMKATSSPSRTATIARSRILC